MQNESSIDTNALFQKIDALKFQAMLRAASTSSVRHFCLFGRRLTRFQTKEPVREQLQNVLSKNKEFKEAPRADTIQPRPLRQVLIRGGLFYLMTNGLFVTAALWYDSKNVRPKMQSMFDEFRRFFDVPPIDALERHAAATKLIRALIGANVAVFLLWKVPALMPAMGRYFTSSVASKSLCLPMFLSMFSHQQPLHLFFNMYVLQSFAIGAIGLLGPAQFMAMFLSGGVFSGLLSLCNSAYVGSAITSLGASGAICAVIGYVCSKLPDLPVHIIFLPMFSFSANYGLYGLLAFETVCLLRILPLHRLVSFDHAAHIGGLLFGMYYAHYEEPIYRHVVNWMRGNVGGLPTISSSTTTMIVNRKKGEKGTNDDGWTTTPKQQQQNNAFRKFRQHLIDEHETQHERQKAIDKKHENWAQTMAEQKKAEKERIRRNREARARRKAAAKSGSADEEIEDDDD
uniref:rhomboid protease n=1 Tax=Globodera rostochiensis TaxID=31243 RepID=A0A914HJZ9_GLORO